MAMLLIVALILSIVRGVELEAEMFAKLDHPRGVKDKFTWKPDKVIASSAKVSPSKALLIEPRKPAKISEKKGEKKSDSKSGNKSN